MKSYEGKEIMKVRWKIYVARNVAIKLQKNIIIYGKSEGTRPLGGGL
jgi:hypothetical protein